LNFRSASGNTREISGESSNSASWSIIWSPIPWTSRQIESIIRLAAIRRSVEITPGGRSLERDATHRVGLSDIIRGCRCVRAKVRWLWSGAVTPETRITTRCLRCIRRSRRECSPRSRRRPWRNRCLTPGRRLGWRPCSCPTRPILTIRPALGAVRRFFSGR